MESIAEPNIEIQSTMTVQEQLDKTLLSYESYDSRMEAICNLDTKLSKDLRDKLAQNPDDENVFCMLFLVEVLKPLNDLSCIVEELERLRFLTCSHHKIAQWNDDLDLQQAFLLLQRESSKMSLETIDLPQEVKEKICNSLVSNDYSSFEASVSDLYTNIILSFAIQETTSNIIFNDVQTDSFDKEYWIHSHILKNGAEVSTIRLFSFPVDNFITEYKANHTVNINIRQFLPLYIKQLEEYWDSYSPTFKETYYYNRIINNPLFKTANSNIWNKYTEDSQINQVPKESLFPGMVAAVRNDYSLYKETLNFQTTAFDELALDCKQKGNDIWWTGARFCFDILMPLYYIGKTIKAHQENRCIHFGEAGKWLMFPKDMTITDTYIIYQALPGNDKTSDLPDMHPLKERKIVNDECTSLLIAALEGNDFEGYLQTIKEYDCFDLVKEDSHYYIESLPSIDTILMSDESDPISSFEWKNPFDDDFIENFYYGYEEYFFSKRFLRPYMGAKLEDAIKKYKEWMNAYNEVKASFSFMEQYYIDAVARKAITYDESLKEYVRIVKERFIPNNLNPEYPPCKLKDEECTYPINPSLFDETYDIKIDPKEHLALAPEVVKAGPITFCRFINQLAKDGYIDDDYDSLQQLVYRLSGLDKPEQVELVQFKSVGNIVNNLCYLIKCIVKFDKKSPSELTEARKNHKKDTKNASQDKNHGRAKGRYLYANSFICINDPDSQEKWENSGGQDSTSADERFKNIIRFYYQIEPK